MVTHRANGFNGRSQNFVHAGEQHRTSYRTNMLPSSAQSPVQQIGSAVRIVMYGTNPPNGYYGSPGQADQYLTESPTHTGYTTQQDHLSGHNGQSYGPDERLVRGEFQEYQNESHTPPGNKRPFLPLAESYTMGTLTTPGPHPCNFLNALANASHHVPALQFSNSEGAPAPFRQIAYEGRSADRAVPDEVQGMCDGISLPLSSPGRNPEMKSLEIPSRQHPTVRTPSSSPPTQDARQSPAIRNSIPPSQALPESCPCPYPHCNRQFTGSSRKGNMSRHVRTKHGAPGSVAREYPCSSQGCEKTFRRNDAKLNHERKEHPELGRLSAVPRKPLSQAATGSPGMSTPQKQQWS